MVDLFHAHILSVQGKAASGTLVQLDARCAKSSPPSLLTGGGEEGVRENLAHRHEGRRRTPAQLQAASMQTSGVRAEQQSLPLLADPVDAGYFALRCARGNFVLRAPRA